MIEAIPKIADVKLLKELSKIIITPMIIAAYLIQSDFSIFSITIDRGASLSLQAFQFGVVFLLSSLVVGSILYIVHVLLIYLHIFTQAGALSILSTLFLAFGFIGVFGEEIIMISLLNEMWFYASFVCGFYLLARAADIENLFS